MPPLLLFSTRGTLFASPGRVPLTSHTQLHRPSTQQCRTARYLARPKRPYTFTQLVTLSDGSTYLHRTSSPAAVHLSTKDARNTPLWNPSSMRLRSVEADAAGKLRAFRERFGRGWDARSGSEQAVTEESVMEERELDDNLMDLISEYGREAASETGSAEAKKKATKAEREKVGKT